MKSWNRPEVPRLDSPGLVPRVFNSASGAVELADAEGGALLYVCGITPYDATHLGHAATYLAFDTLVRVWLDAGYSVTYAQNTTDVDDPLLERAAATGVDWRDLAESQTELFRGDMAALTIIPPDHYVAVTDVVPAVAVAVSRLLELGLAYPVDADESIDNVPDLYFDSAGATRTTRWYLGSESRLDRDTMLALSAERGGDPERVGKRDKLDPLLWRAAREGEPAWDSVCGRGRPGWHIECSVIATDSLAPSITVQGGGSDLIFPHHEFSAGHAEAITGEPFARIYAHAGMVGFEGQKMSKSLGNLVLVSTLIADGADARALRLALLAHHYRSDWEWTPLDLELAQSRLARWVDWAAGALPTSSSLLGEIRAAIADDLDTPLAISVIDAAVASGAAATNQDVVAISALLGVALHR